MNANQRITKISDLGLTIIKHFESLRLSAYLCPANVWTIGYGTTRYPDGSKVRRGDKITSDAALCFLRSSLSLYEKSVDDATRDDICQHQFDALVSLCYNIGPANFRRSSLVKMVNAGDPDSQIIMDKFLLWQKATDDGRLVSLPGLVRRRKSEAHLFNTGEINFFQITQP